MLIDHDDPNVEGAKNLVRFWGRPALCLAAVVAGLFIFTKIDGALDRGPTSHTPIYHPVPGSADQNSNGVLPTFDANLSTPTTAPDSGKANSNRSLPPFNPTSPTG